MPKYLDLEGLKYYDQKLKDYINQESSYVVPEGGIPLTDLAEGVQQSLGKADTALQSSDIANSLSESDDSPVSASAVYTAIVEDEKVISAALNDLNTNKQNKLVSGTNIKTINNQSLLGEGNITISGGGSGDGGDESCCKKVVLTRAEYTALANNNALDEDTLYVVLEAQSEIVNDIDESTIQYNDVRISKIQPSGSSGGGSVPLG